jgi:hypothetical protein
MHTDPTIAAGAPRDPAAPMGPAIARNVERDGGPQLGSSIGAHAGLVPCEYTSGNSRVQGSITKAGRPICVVC